MKTINSKVLVLASVLFAGAIASSGTACVTDSGGDDEMMEEEECGDHVCNGAETSATCAQDCPRMNPNPETVCGNGVCEAGENSSCTADCMASLRVTNSSTYTIYNLYVWRCTESGPGTDQLGANVLSPSNAFTLTNIPPGCWMFKARNSTSIMWQTPTGVQLNAGQQYTWNLIN